MTGIFIIVLVVALIAWLIAPGMRKAAPEADEVEPVDEAELETAENEVRDLDVNQRPEDGFEGDDWGPGVAKSKE
jgi:hypothetical protein